MLALKIEQRPGARVVASKLIALSEVLSAGSWENLWLQLVQTKLTEMEKSICGPVVKAFVSGGELSGFEFSLNDTELKTIIEAAVDPERRLVSLTFVVQQPLPGEEAQVRPSELLRSRTELFEIPVLDDRGHPATTALYARLRAALVANGVVGVRNAEHTKSVLTSLTKVLYNSSTFFENFKGRGGAIPEYFAFAAGANNYKAKSKPVGPNASCHSG
jgi:hypothetical protein